MGGKPTAVLRLADHPREYGENVAGMTAEELRVGSSPRIRGEYLPRRRPNTVIGDHPREYGENAGQPIELRVEDGSSPRIRGECWKPNVNTVRCGIIPANTGRIFPESEKCFSAADHPREYGENLLRKMLANLVLGSSPRIRGESTMLRPLLLGSGIIPANTGRMKNLAYRQSSRGDHPREYGENSVRPSLHLR